MDFLTQMLIWGYADYQLVWIDYLQMGAARVGERTWNQPHMWDTPERLDNTLLNGERPPDWHACYWIGEHIRRGHEVLSH